MSIRVDVLAKSLILLSLALAPSLSQPAFASPKSNGGSEADGGRDSGGGNHDGKGSCESGTECGFSNDSQTVSESYFEYSRASADGGRDSGGNSDDPPQCDGGKDCE